jgi:putative membrane protein
MQRSLIIIIIITLLVVVFALQNSITINLKIWFWTVDIPAGLALIVTFAVGILLGIISSLPRLMKRNREIRDLKEKIAQGTEREGTTDAAGPSKKGDDTDPEFEDVIND